MNRALLAVVALGLAACQRDTASGLELVLWSEGALPLGERMRDDLRRDPGLSRLPCAVADSGADAARFQALTGAPGSLALCVVDRAGVVAGAWLGYAGADQLRWFVAAACAQLPSIRAATQQLRRDAEDLAAHDALARAYEASGSDALAAQHWRRLADRGSPAAHARLARLEACRGRIEHARAHLTRAAPGDAATALTLAVVLAKELRAADALAALARAAAAPEDGGLRLLTLADALHQTGDGAGAVRALEQLQREHPDSRWRDAAQEQLDHLRAPSHGHSH